MHSLRHLSTALILLAGLIVTPTPVRAAQDYDNCTGFITSLPATISTSGTWCMNQDLSTAMVSGNAIIIITNNVTIDCNGFKLGGLAAGAGTQTNGINASNFLNATVRHCNIRGFLNGVGFFGPDGGGHVVEDNRFDGNTRIGLYAGGDGSVVRRNLVRDTGGSTAIQGSAYGIFTLNSVDVLDNTVSGVLPSASGGNGTAYGIYVNNSVNASISGNRVRKLVPLGTGTANGIYNAGSSRMNLAGNHVVNNSPGNIGLHCDLALSSGSAKDNIVSGFATGISNCSNGVGDDNVVKP